jgi:hypothetical protein
VFTPGFCGFRITRSLVLCKMFCRSLFVLFYLAIALSVLRFTDSDYLFGIFKLLYFYNVSALFLLLTTYILYKSYFYKNNLYFVNTRQATCLKDEVLKFQ